MADVLDVVKGKDVLLSISTNTETPAYSVLVCQINGGLAGTRDVQTTTTKNCGTAKSGGSPNYTVTGTLLANTTPGVGELSADDLLALFESGDSFLFKFAHSTTPADLYRQGAGFFSSYSETYNDGENVSADFTIEVEGSLDLVP
jgi:hypothetical protein